MRKIQGESSKVRYKWENDHTHPQRCPLSKVNSSAPFVGKIALENIFGF